MPNNHKTTNGILLGQWASYQRSAYNKGQLSKERVELLKSQNFVWDPIEAEWQKNFAALEEYVRENDNALVPNNHKTADGIFLGIWVSVQRGTYKKGQLSPKRVALLESKKDWTWNLFEADWQKNFAALEKYVRENDNALVPYNHKTTDGILLGVWVSTQRRAYNKDQLSPERIALLESQKDWVWKTKKGPTSSKS